MSSRYCHGALVRRRPVKRPTENACGTERVSSKNSGPLSPRSATSLAVDRGQRIAHRGAVRRDGAGVAVERRYGEGVDGHRRGVVRLGRLPGGPGAVRFLVEPGEGERVAADGVVDHRRRGVQPLREESRLLLLLRLVGEQCRRIPRRPGRRRRSGAATAPRGGGPAAGPARPPAAGRARRCRDRDRRPAHRRWTESTPRDGRGRAPRSA